MRAAGEEMGGDEERRQREKGKKKGKRGREEIGVEK